MTTPGERRAKIDAGENPAGPTGATVRTEAGLFAAGAGSRTTAVFRRVLADEARRAAEAKRRSSAEGRADERENGGAH